MHTQRQHRIADQLAQLAAAFLQRESNRQSLLTVTRADISPDFARATVYFTVLPESYEQEALDFTKRKRAEFRAHVKKNLDLRRLPFFDFEIDRGEKHRQRLDLLDA